MDEVLYQKLGITISSLAYDFLGRLPGDRIPPISDYQEELKVSRGTIQNALSYLKEREAVEIKSCGHMGSFLVNLDIKKLQACCLQKEMLGSMTLPYSMLYQGLSTALERELSDLAFNLVYTRGAEGRLRMVRDGIYQFAICSLNTAQKAMSKGMNLKIAIDFGPGTYLSKHVLILKDSSKDKIEDGMRVAYDSGSLDQRDIVDLLTKDKKNIRFVETRAHHTLSAIQAGKIDAGVWNYDDIIENNYQGFNVITLEDKVDLPLFSTAVLVVEKSQEAIENILCNRISVSRVREIQKAVKAGKITAGY